MKYGVVIVALLVGCSSEPEMVEIEQHPPQMLSPTWTICPGTPALLPGQLYIMSDPELQRTGVLEKCWYTSIPSGTVGCIDLASIPVAMRGWGGIGYGLKSFMWNLNGGISTFEKSNCTYTAVLANRKLFYPPYYWVTHVETWVKSNGATWNNGVGSPYLTPGYIGSFYVAN